MDASALTRKICSVYNLRRSQLVIRREAIGWTTSIYREQRKILVATIQQTNNESYSLILAATPYHAEESDNARRCIEAAWSLLGYFEKRETSQK